MVDLIRYEYEYELITASKNTAPLADIQLGTTATTTDARVFIVSIEEEATPQL